MSDRKYRAGLEAQLNAAHETIEQLRQENATLFGAVRFVREFHDECVCRHSRRALNDAYAYVTDEARRDAPIPSSPAGDANPNRPRPRRDLL